MSERPRDPAFAERLKGLLLEKGIKNNNRFSRAIHKSPTVTLKWLKGGVPEYPRDVKLLCDFFNVSADYLVFGKEFEKKEEPSRIVLELPEKVKGFVFILKDPDHKGGGW
jgi:transcriptional regulator with XRE-family HTH domain